MSSLTPRNFSNLFKNGGQKNVTKMVTEERPGTIRIPPTIRLRGWAQDLLRLLAPSGPSGFELECTASSGVHLMWKQSGAGRAA